jgi:predicted nucleic acid-binding protein
LSAVADTGALYALYDADDKNHARVRQALDGLRGPIYVPSAILGEIDYLLREWLGVDAELAYLESLRRGAFRLENLTEEELQRCSELLQTYRDINLGLADASVIAVAERLGISTILTLDERDFRAVTPATGPFRLLPADL